MRIKVFVFEDGNGAMDRLCARELVTFETAYRKEYAEAEMIPIPIYEYFMEGSVVEKAMEMFTAFRRVGKQSGERDPITAWEEIAEDAVLALLRLGILRDRDEEENWPSGDHKSLIKGRRRERPRPLGVDPDMHDP